MPLAFQMATLRLFVLIPSNLIAATANGMSYRIAAVRSTLSSTMPQNGLTLRLEKAKNSMRRRTYKAGSTTLITVFRQTFGTSPTKSAGK